MNRLILLLFIHSIFILSFTSYSFSSFAQKGFDGFDQAEVVIYLKRIRDEEGNYLPDVTKVTAREVAKGGEFQAKPHKRGVSGPVIEVGPPQFNFAKHQEGMSKKDMATAGLGLVSEVGGIFGFGHKVAKVDEMSARINSNDSVLAAWGDNEQIMVTMTSHVVLIDDQIGTEIKRAINYEKVFNSKAEFTAQKERIIEDAVVGEVKKILVEYLEELE